jgi:hypothetical protein
LKTASFFEYSGLGRISIARFPPRGTPAGFRVYRALAPGPWFKSVDEAEYRRRYGVALAALDPPIVWDDLHALANGAEPVLLCWERKADLAAGRTFCHRRIVAAWLEAEFGVAVDER